jgi:hypothetical protein
MNGKRGANIMDAVEYLNYLVNKPVDDKHFRIVAEPIPQDAERAMNRARIDGYGYLGVMPLVMAANGAQYGGWVIMGRVTDKAAETEVVPVPLPILRTEYRPTGYAVATDVTLAGIMALVSRLTHVEQIRLANRLPDAMKEHILAISKLDDSETLPFSDDVFDREVN